MISHHSLKSDITMASQETQCVPRQSLLSFFSENPTFVNLCFTHEIEIHDHEQSDDDGNLTINVLVLLTLTTRLDGDIEALTQEPQTEEEDEPEFTKTDESASPRTLSLPFGDKKTFKQLLQ